MRNVLVQAVAIAVVMLSLACSKKPANGEADLPKPEPTPLFKPAVSYWSFEKTKEELGYKNWDVLEDRKPLVSDRRPPYRFVAIRVPEYKDHGFSGDLVLSFYNDRLMKTQYFVPNMDEYLAAAGSDQQVSLSKEGAGGISPHTRVWRGKDAEGKSYVGFEDEVLNQQMKDWIQKYSMQ